MKTESADFTFWILLPTKKELWHRRASESSPICDGTTTASTWHLSPHRRGQSGTSIRWIREPTRSRAGSEAAPTELMSRSFRNRNSSTGNLLTVGKYQAFFI